MDLQILLALQEVRNFLGAAWITFFSKMTFFGEVNTAIIIIAAIYWCINKNIGTYLLLGWHWNRIINGFLKVTVCCYRPWIRNPKIMPPEAIIKTATGYSFPSGHSTNAGSVFGGLGLNKEVDKKLRIFCWIMVVLVCLSRCYFGVHTPQDVLVAIIYSIAVMLLSSFVLKLIEQKKNLDIWIGLGSIVVAVIVAIYAATKSYPVDYDKDGKILVEGAKMAVDTFRCTGLNVGFFAGLILERRFVRFSTTDVPMSQRCLRFALGLFGFYIVDILLRGLVNVFISGFWGYFITSLLVSFYVVFVCPLIFSLIEKKLNNK